MRPIRDFLEPLAKPADSVEASRTDALEAPSTDAVEARDGQIERIVAALAACEKLGDTELARRTGRTLLAVVACATDALLADGGQALQSAPDKFGAYFDKAAAGYVQAIDGLGKRAALAETAVNNGAAARNVADPPCAAYPSWRSAARE
jgi:hypothetical protein